MPDITGKPFPDNQQVFTSLCQARALLFEAGTLSLPDAVDFLQQWAVSRGLVAEIGQDAVQSIIGEAFRKVAP